MRNYFCSLFLKLVSTLAGVELSGFGLLICRHYYDSNLIWRTVPRVDEAIPLDHPRREGGPMVWPHPREVILYGRSNYYTYNNMFTIKLFHTLF